MLTFSNKMQILGINIKKIKEVDTQTNEIYRG